MVQSTLKASGSRIVESVKILINRIALAKIIVVVLFLWFAFQTIFFAFNVRYGIPPDEAFHHQVSLLYHETDGFRVEYSPKTYHLGAFADRPYLYHLILGKLLHLNCFDIDPVVFSRLFSICLGLLTQYFSYLLAREITNNKIIQVCVLVIQTNILMYVFMFGSISYDNLVNLLCVASYYYLLRFLRTYSRTHLILLFFTMFAGALTKRTFLPIMLFEVVILLFYLKNIILNKYELIKGKLKFKEIILFIFVALLAILNGQLYGNNIIKYGRIKPDADQIFGHEIAMKRGTYKRNFELKRTIQERPKISFFSYLPKWFFALEGRIFGIMGHKNITKKKNQLIVENIFLIISFFLVLINWKRLISDRNLVILLLISSGYLIVVFIVNYYFQMEFRLFGMGLQGRYIFPIITPLLIVLTYFFMMKFNDAVKVALTLAIGFAAIHSGFVYFLRNASDMWYR